MKQPQRKNNTNRDLSLPASAATYFTIQDLVKLNSNLLTASKSDITIRVKLTKKIEDGKVVEIGSLTGGKGRPQKVFVVAPVTQLVINKAKADSINLVDNADKLVNAINVSTPTQTATVPTAPTVVTSAV